LPRSGWMWRCGTFLASGQYSGRFRRNEAIDRLASSMSVQQRRWLATDTGYAAPDSAARDFASAGGIRFSREDFFGSLGVTGSDHSKPNSSSLIFNFPVDVFCKTGATVVYTVAPGTQSP